MATDNRLFINKNVVKPNYTLASIDDILHRDEEIRKYYEYLKDIFIHVSPSNLFIYGKPGLGKTVLTKLIFEEVKREAENRGIELCIIHINCDEIRTEHAILQKLVQEMPSNEPKRVLGNSRDKHTDYLKYLINDYSGILIFVFDELDKAATPEMINKIIRTQSTKSGQFPTIIGITNDLELKDRFPPQLMSVLCENDLIINPYDALQLFDIIRARADIAFKKDVIADSEVSLCAAYAAQDHGDARRAIDLLRVSGEVAESKNHSHIEEEDVRYAHSKIEIDKVIEVVKTLPSQSKLALLACIYVDNSSKENDTNNIYAVYRSLCNALRMDSLTQRRVTDLLSELDQLGVIEGSNFFKGRQGRKKIITKITSKEQALDVIYCEFGELEGKQGEFIRGLNG